MDTIIVKKKSFNVVEQIDENNYKAERKGKTYLVRTFSDEPTFSHFVSDNKILKNTGVPVYRQRVVDKKTYKIAFDYIEGENVLDLILAGKMNEKVYEQIFLVNYLAKTNQIALDWDPVKWMFTGEKVIYLDTYSEPLTKENPFHEKGVYLWFYTKQLEEYLISKGIPLKKELRKPDFEINKEIVLTTVKYYH